MSFKNYQKLCIFRNQIDLPILVDKGYFTKKGIDKLGFYCDDSSLSFAKFLPQNPTLKESITIIFWNVAVPGIDIAPRVYSTRSLLKLAILVDSNRQEVHEFAQDLLDDLVKLYEKKKGD